MHLEHRMDDLPTPVRHTAHGNLPESCRISSPSPEAMNFVLVMFTWRPLDSNPSFHALTRSTHSSREVAVITRSWAENSSQGTPTLKSLDKASSTMIKSSGLRVGTVTVPSCQMTHWPLDDLDVVLRMLQLIAALFIFETYRRSSAAVLSCGGTCQIWVWFTAFNRYVLRLEILLMVKFASGAWLDPNPELTIMTPREFRWS